MSKFTKALDMAEGQEVKFEDAVLTTPGQVKKAKLTWKITRNTRPDTDVRRELAGISKRIEALLEEDYKIDS